jgi:hypothetical protein
MFLDTAEYYSETVRSINRLTKAICHALQYIHNSCLKSAPTCIDTPWVPSLCSLHCGYSSTFEMVRYRQQSHTLEHILKLFTKTQEKPPLKR